MKLVLYFKRAVSQDAHKLEVPVFSLQIHKDWIFIAVGHAFHHE